MAAATQGLVSFLTWLLVQAACMGVAYVLMMYISKPTADDYKAPGSMQIDNATRIITNYRDTLEILFLTGIGIIYWVRVAALRHSSTQPLIVADPASNTCAHPMGNYLWAGVSPYAKLGDSLSMAGVTNYWTPFLLFVASRILAFCLGLVPGLLGGIPTFTAQLIQGIIWAYWCRDLWKYLGVPENTMVRSWICSSFCCCIVAAEGAVLLDEADGVRVSCALQLEAVGPPVSVK